MKDKDQQTLDDAREQADEHDGFLRSGKVKARKTGKVYTIPNLQLLDDDQQQAYDRYIHELQQCDRYPDVQVPERTIKTTDPETGEVTETTIAGHTLRGDFIEPYQKDGKLIEPPYNVRLTQILLGDKYEEFKNGGGRSADVRQELLRMKRETEERVRNDSKSRDGAGAVEDVSDAD